MRFKSMVDVDFFVIGHPKLMTRLSEDCYGAAKIEIRPYVYVHDEELGIARHDLNGFTLLVGEFPNNVMVTGYTLEEAYFKLGYKVIEKFGDYESIEYIYESEEA